MSKRFGRRQRRAAREKIAALEAAGSEAAENYLRASRRASRLASEFDYWQDEITRLLGPESALAPKTAERAVQEIERRPYHTMHERSVRLSPHSWEDHALTSVVHRKISLQQFLIEVQDHPERFSRMVRLVQNDRTNSALLLSNEQFLRQGFGEREIEWLAEEIARQLARHVNADRRAA